MLSKEIMDYSISRSWLEGKKREIISLEKRIAEQGKRAVSCWSFQSYNEFRRSILEMLCSLAEQGKGGFCVMSHLWPTLALSKEELEWFNRLGKTSPVIMCRGNSAMDRSMSAMWERTGFRVSLGAKGHGAQDTIVCGDSIFQVLFPAEMIPGFQSAFAGGKGKGEADMGKYYDVFYRETKIIVAQIKDKEFAVRMRGETIGVAGKPWLKPEAVSGRAHFGEVRFKVL